MVGHGGSSAGSYLADPTSPIPSHCASIVVTSTLRVNSLVQCTIPFTCVLCHVAGLFEKFSKTTVSDRSARQTLFQIVGSFFKIR